MDMLQRSRALAVAALALFALAGAASADPGLTIERQISLGAVSGRIDHLAIDLADGLLFVAELGNGSVSVVDLARGVVVARVTGLAEPQGIAFVEATGTLFVATGGDGMLRTFAVPDLTPGPVIAIGGDADNVHANPAGTLLGVGFANGLALVDPATLTVTASVALDGHAEGFAFDATGGTVFVNIPEAGQIASVDVAAAVVVARWSTEAPGFNFPLAVEGNRVLAGLRSPSGLGVYDAATGAADQLLPLCGDSDDLLTDTARGVVYAICGDGVVQTFAVTAAGLNRVAETATARGARTGLFVPDLDRLFVAVPQQGGLGASVMVLVPPLP